jgi:hypothetical protein
MAYTTIDKPSDYFDTLLWTGNGTSTRNITGLNFQPDLSWKKERGFAFSIGNMWYDSVRGLGVDKHLDSTSTAVEGSGNDNIYGYYTAFISGGFSVVDGPSGQDYVNGSGYQYVAWNWKANGAGISNTVGSVSSTVSANNDAGFSIVSYAGGQAANFTVGHGLNVAPNFVITKQRNVVNNWGVYFSNTGTNNRWIELNLNNGVGTNNGSLTNGSYLFSNSTTLSIDSAAYANAGSSMIAYCFAEKKGYSKFSSYTGNNSTNGPFCYTGFKPAFVMVKLSSGAGENWYVFDKARDTSNPVKKWLVANQNGVESPGGDVVFFDFLSNGFKVRNTGTFVNTSGAQYIYMAFAENPFVSSTGIPTTAR